jgi:hypothetical protein
MPPTVVSRRRESEDICRPPASSPVHHRAAKERVQAGHKFGHLERLMLITAYSAGGRQADWMKANWWAGNIDLGLHANLPLSKQGTSVENSHSPPVHERDGAAVPEVRQATAHRLDRKGEVIAISVWVVE